MHPGLHGTTFGGGPLSCAVAIEFLKQVEELLPHIVETGDYFRSQLDQLATKHVCIREVRGMGLMLALELNSADLAKNIARRLLEEGIIINRTHETVLRFLPPYIIEKKHVDSVTSALSAALAACSSPAPHTPRKKHAPARSNS
jgi:acetylornithine aminotransferase/acetylornithine/N-succinyldiaminopimelate aminotransferase